MSVALRHASLSRVASDVAAHPAERQRHLTPTTPCRTDLRGRQGQARYCCDQALQHAGEHGMGGSEEALKAAGACMQSPRVRMHASYGHGPLAVGARLLPTGVIGVRDRVIICPGGCMTSAAVHLFPMHMHILVGPLQLGRRWGAPEWACRLQILL